MRSLLTILAGLLALAIFTGALVTAGPVDVVLNGIAAPSASAVDLQAP